MLGYRRRTDKSIPVGSFWVYAFSPYSNPPSLATIVIVLIPLNDGDLRAFVIEVLVRLEGEAAEAAATAEEEGQSSIDTKYLNNIF